MTGQTLGAPGQIAPTIASAISSLQPASWWKLDEVTGSLADSAGAIAGTYVSGTRAQKGPRGSRCIDVAANTAAATFGDNYPFLALAPFTVVAIVRPTATFSATQYVFGKHGASGLQGWGLLVNADGTTQSYRGFGTGVAVNSPHKWTLNDYNVIGMIYDGATQTNYLNGITTGAADTNSVAVTTNVIRANGNPSDLSGCQGRFAHIAIWTAALAPAALDSIFAEV